MLTLVPIWAVMGLSWNMLSGYSGLVSFGHAAFFGLGAYTVTLLLVHFDITPWLGIPLGMVVGAVAGAADRLSDVPPARPLLRAVRCSPTRWRCSTCSSGSATRKWRCR